MSFLDGILQFFCADRINSGIKRISVEFLEKSMSTASCSNSEINDGCRNDSAALVLKALAISSILVAGVAGISIPLLSTQRRYLRADSNLFVIAKAFAAGVILATGFVHMLSDGASALSSSCLPSWPWSKFPFAGFFAMLASLCTLVVDFMGTQYYERKNYSSRQNEGVEIPEGSMLSDQRVSLPADCNRNGKLFGEEDGGGMHIVGIHAHAAHHRHSHPHGEDACDSHSLSCEPGRGDEAGGVRHVVVSQVLELGIVSHSVIIGLSLGVSHSPCTVRPLMGALSFHQFFEGLALGGCISQAQFNTLSATLMAFFFAVTTPAGIAIGISVSSFYNANSARALAIEGTLDSISAGILVYMALVDLIAADFLSKKMRCNPSLQLASYFALFLGSLSMSSLAIWA